MMQIGDATHHIEWDIMQEPAIHKESTNGTEIGPVCYLYILCANKSTCKHFVYININLPGVISMIFLR
jgi:hypothetical protein